MENQAFNFLSIVWSIFGIVGIAICLFSISIFYVFRFLSVKWLDRKFQEKLESYKHAQNQEVEKLKFRISRLIDRASKIHEKEFEYLPKVWISLNEAHQSSLYLLGGLRQYPNLNNLTPEKMELFVANCDLNDWQKEELKRSASPMKFYISCQNHKELKNAQEAFYNYRIDQKKHAIFFEKEIRDKFNGFSDLIWSAIVEFEIFELEDGAPKERDKRRALRENGQNHLDELEELVRKRLWNAHTETLG